MKQAVRFDVSSEAFKALSDSYVDAVHRADKLRRKSPKQLQAIERELDELYLRLMKHVRCTAKVAFKERRKSARRRVDQLCSAIKIGESKNAVLGR